MKRKICFAAWALALMLLLPLCAALAEATIRLVCIIERSADR